MTEQDSDRIVQTVASGDVVVLALGEPELWSGEAGSRSVIELPEHQISLLKKLHEHQIPVVVLLFNGRPLDLRKVKEYADAVLEMWFPGTEGGNAVAALLYGEKNPSGKLAMSFPYGSGQIPVSYDMAPTGLPKADLMQEPRYKSQYLDIPNEPLYSFGYGLSYTEYDVQVQWKNCQTRTGIPGTCEGDKSWKYDRKNGSPDLYREEKIFGRKAGERTCGL